MKLVHQGTKDFRCEECSKKFNIVGNLKRHLKVVHYETKDFECEECSSKFGEKSDLKTHVKTVYNAKNAQRNLAKRINKAYTRKQSMNEQMILHVKNAQRNLIEM